MQARGRQQAGLGPLTLTSTNSHYWRLGSPDKWDADWGVGGDAVNLQWLGEQQTMANLIHPANNVHFAAWKDAFAALK